MDTITSLVGVLETALEGGEPTTSLSSLNALYALYALQNRAEAAEAENARLREQVAALRAAVTRSRMMMDFNEFVGALRSAGWYSKADAQHRHIRVVWETLIARAEAAEAEVGRLQAAPDQWKQCGDAIMLCATGRAAPLSDSDVCGEIVRLRERNKELEMWFSVALDLLSDFLETLN